MIRNQIKKEIKKAIEAEYPKVRISLEEIHLEHPQNEKWGDYATNIAMTLSKQVKQSPMEIAKKIKYRIETNLNKLDNEFKRMKAIASIEVAPPGFINLKLSSNWLQSEIKTILERVEGYGTPNLPSRASRSSGGPGARSYSGQRTALQLQKGEDPSTSLPAASLRVFDGGDKPRGYRKVQVEFVSANPTGPLHIGNARGGPIGDVLANVLEKAGYEVEREFYVNDVGGQVERFGYSLLHFYKKELGVDSELPEGGYPGEYVQELAKNITKKVGKKYLARPEEKVAGALAKTGVDWAVKSMKKTCAKMGIEFDSFYYESEAAKSGLTAKIIKKLKEKGFTGEKEGALWFSNKGGSRTHVAATHGSLNPEKEARHASQLQGLDFLGDRECVLVKSDGDFGYFANDIAYHWSKFKERKFDLVIDVWGANHQGHVPRMKAAMVALGIDPDRLQLPLYQWVSLRRGGKKLSMGKRLGVYVTAEEVLDEVGRDAFRFMFLMRDARSHLEFDLDLAKKESKENPVYYVQYAHARICSIIRKFKVKSPASAKASAGRRQSKVGNVKLLNKPEELGLIRKLIQLPELIEDISQNFAVHQLTFYAIELADLFHKFYEKHQVLSDDKDLTQARLALIKATKIVLQNTLALLGVSAPEKM